MNFEICKKCEYNRFHEFYFTLFPHSWKCELQSRLNNNCAICYNSIRAYKIFEEWHRNYHNNTIPYIIEDKSAEPKNTCPYYAEHQISKWNEE
jgi:hypothetical protein